MFISLKCELLWMRKMGKNLFKMHAYIGNVWTENQKTRKPALLFQFYFGSFIKLKLSIKDKEFEPWWISALFVKTAMLVKTVC